jgi:Calx-beta domain
MRSARARAFLTVLVVAGVLGFPVIGQAPGSAAAACGAFHARGFLSGFQPFSGSLFYAAREGLAASASVVVSPGCSDSAPGIESVVVHYVTEPGTAASGTDYAENDGQTGLLCSDVHAQCAAQGESPNSQQNVTLMMGPPGTEEAAVEAFRFRLTGTTPTETPPGYQEPFSVPVYVVDADGPTRAALEPGIASYSRSETFANILIPVFGAGASPPGSVSYTLAPDPSAPATPGQDFQDLTGGSVPINNGVGYINIGIVNDKLGEGPENVVVTLSGTVEGPASTTFTILDNEESVKPTSRFHHPRHKWRYKKSDYRIREFHVFTQDNAGGAGVVAAELALRRNLKNGKCGWLTKGGWKKQDCQNREWLPTKYDDVGELFYYRMKQLKSSVGTKIKNYTAFSRAIDGAENVENDFVKKRNDNTFEIKRARKKRR